MLFDSPASLEPDDVLNWFDLCNSGLAREEQEAYRLMRTQIGTPHPSFLTDVVGVGASFEEVGEHFKACKRELEIATILALTASAEARIRLDATTRMKANTDHLAQRLSLLRSNASTDWRIPLYENGIVDAWKTYIGSLPGMLSVDRARLLTAIGRFKNLLQIRHWVAHGRYWELQRGIEHYPPAAATEMVIELYDALRRAANHGSLMSFV